MDKDGVPTTDANAILNGGSLHAVGGLKGTMLALAVELICCALTGAVLSHQLESLHLAEGSPLKLGQAFIVLAPASLAGNDIYNDRVEALVEAMLQEEGVRLPGDRRHKLAAQAAQEGVEASDAVLAQLRGLACLA
jgi:(2R)-3-sulfolactate dehydrogenase (NADP+)